MKYYTQTNPEYCDLELAPYYSIKHYGCFFCCIATLAQINPKDLLAKCKAAGYCFTSKGLLYPGKVGSVAGIPYLGVFNDKPSDISIIMLTNNKLQNLTHFVIMLEDGSVFDPLVGILSPEEFSGKYKDYKIQNYRVFDFPKSWISVVKKKGMELGITNGERMEDFMTRAEGVQLCLNLLDLLHNLTK